MTASLIASLLGAMLAGAQVPDEAFLQGQWGCTDNTFVFMEKAGPVPDKKDVLARTDGMGATKDNCVLSFSEGHKLNFRVGKKAFDLTWTLDRRTKKFSTTIGLFTITGYLIQKGEKIILIYSRPDLFLIMRFLCSREGRTHIGPLGKLLDMCEGLTLGMIFTRK